MITHDMCEVASEQIQGSCKGCIAEGDVYVCNEFRDCFSQKKIYKLKREYKPHYHTAPANYRDSENDLS